MRKSFFYFIQSSTSQFLGYIELRVLRKLSLLLSPAAYEAQGVESRRRIIIISQLMKLQS